MHTSIIHPLVTLNGKVLTSGGAGNLAKGQLALVTDKSTTSGRKVVAPADFAGMPKNQKLQIRLGRNKMPQGLRSPYANHYETSWFTPESITEIKANFPKNQVQTFDSYAVGYDGINANTAFNIPEGKSSLMDITLDGKAIELFAGEKEHNFSFHFGREVGQTTQEVVRKLVETIKDAKVPRSRKSITDFIDVAIIDSSNSPLSGVGYTFSKISVTDNGDSNDLADIQGQYPTYKVVRSDRNGLVSEYTILHPTASSLADYSLVQNSSYVKGCADCLSGYSSIVGGVVYHIRIADAGTDVSTTVDNLPGFVAGSAVKVGQDGAVGIYSVVVDNDLTDAEKASFVTSNPTAIIKKIGSTEGVCEKGSTTAFAWVAGTTCVKSSKQYTIQLQDSECGTSRLTELQNAFPELVIEEGVPTGNATQTVTVSSDVALVVVVNGVTYITADAGTVAQTATAFFVAHAAAILADTGVVLTNPSSAVLLFSGATVGFPSIVSTAQTVGTKDYVTTASVGGCQRVYSTYVTTDLVCEDCSNIFLQPFMAEAPKSFEDIAWVEAVEVFDENALMGIRFTGKPFKITPTEATRESIPFYETSTRIRSIAGGYRDWDYLNAPEFNYDQMFVVRELSRARDRDALGAMLFPLEVVSRAHYLGEKAEYNNLFAKANLGEESVIKFDSQYVSYTISWHDTKLSQGMGGRSNITHSEQLWAEIGYHDNLEAIVNALAAKAGVEVVNPTAN
jgi:hypothetical protein